MLACLEQTASLGPTIEVWGPRTGSCWGFSSSLDATRFSCSYFSFQCNNFCYRAKSARLPGCRLPNPLAVLPGVFNGICVGLGVKQRQPWLLPGVSGTANGSLVLHPCILGWNSACGKAGPIAPEFSLQWSNTKLPGMWPKQTNSLGLAAEMSLENSCAPQVRYKPTCWENLLSWRTKIPPRKPFASVQLPHQELPQLSGLQIFCCRFYFVLP